MGLILGTKIFINFTKYPFEECILRLKKELKNISPVSMVIEPNTSEPSLHAENKVQSEVKQITISAKNWKNKVFLWLEK